MTEELEEAINLASAAGYIIICPATKCDQDEHAPSHSLQFPGKLGNVLCIGSHSSTNASEFSGKGREVNFLAPGEDIQGAHGEDDKIHSCSGVSYAVSIVAGIVALILLCAETYGGIDLREQISHSQVIKQIFMRMLDQNDKHDPCEGYGILKPWEQIRLGKEDFKQIVEEIISKDKLSRVFMNSERLKQKKEASKLPSQNYREMRLKDTDWEQKYFEDHLRPVVDAISIQNWAEVLFLQGGRCQDFLEEIQKFVQIPDPLEVLDLTNETGSLACGTVDNLDLGVIRLLILPCHVLLESALSTSLNYLKNVQNLIMRGECGIDKYPKLLRVIASLESYHSDNKLTVEISDFILTSAEKWQCGEIPTIKNATIKLCLKDEVQESLPFHKPEDLSNLLGYLPHEVCERLKLPTTQDVNDNIKVLERKEEIKIPILWHTSANTLEEPVEKHYSEKEITVAVFGTGVELGNGDSNIVGRYNGAPYDAEIQPTRNEWDKFDCISSMCYHKIKEVCGDNIKVNFVFLRIVDESYSYCEEWALKSFHWLKMHEKRGLPRVDVGMFPLNFTTFNKDLYSEFQNFISGNGYPSDSPKLVITGPSIMLKKELFTPLGYPASYGNPLCINACDELEDVNKHSPRGREIDFLSTPIQSSSNTTYHEVDTAVINFTSQIVRLLGLTQKMEDGSGIRRALCSAAVMRHVLKHFTSKRHHDRKGYGLVHFEKIGKNNLEKNLKHWIADVYEKIDHSQDLESRTGEQDLHEDQMNTSE